MAGPARQRIAGKSHEGTNREGANSTIKKAPALDSPGQALPPPPSLEVWGYLTVHMEMFKRFCMLFEHGIMGTNGE